MFRKILAAIDRSPSSKSVFDAALTLAKTTGADLMLLHVLSSEEEDSPLMPTLTTIEHYPLGRELSENYWKRWQAYEEEGLNLLRTYTDTGIAAGISAEFTQNSGNPSREICAIARTWNTDLIVIGRRGRSSLNEWITGSVSNYVFHHAPCSVHIVHSLTPFISQASVANQVEVVR